MTLRRLASAVLTSGVLAAAPLLAQKPADAPKNATAQCTDGKYSTAKTEKGACSKHGGVKTWWGAATTSSGAKSTASTPTTKATTAPAKGASPASGGTAATANPPAGSTGQCADGTYTKAKTQKGACSNHGGVKTWFANTPAPSAAPTTPSKPPQATTPPPAPAPKTATPTNTQASTPQTKAAPADAPQGATAKCKDGSYSMAKQQRGACSRHGGVAEWYK